MDGWYKISERCENRVFITSYWMTNLCHVPSSHFSLFHSLPQEMLYANLLGRIELHPTLVATIARSFRNFISSSSLPHTRTTALYSRGTHRQTLGYALANSAGLKGGSAGNVKEDYETMPRSPLDSVFLTSTELVLGTSFRFLSIGLIKRIVA